MSSYSRNTHAQKPAVVDYDRQFQEDLERAQALSLESLALEKFRLQRQQHSSNNVQQSCASRSITRCSGTSSSVSEADGTVEK